MSKARVLVSRCLLGERVRYNGKLKAAPFPLEFLDAFEVVPICPEVLAGMSVPRPPINLYQEQRTGVRAITIHNQDVTQSLRAASQKFAMRSKPIHGAILKARSPSCGLANALIYSQEQAPEANHPSGAVDGIAASELKLSYPHAVFCHEEYLSNPDGREDFALAVNKVRAVVNDANP